MTPLLDNEDPLTAFQTTERERRESTNSDSTENHPPATVPVVVPVTVEENPTPLTRDTSFITDTTDTTDTSFETAASAMVVRIKEAEKYYDGPQGAYVMYLIQCTTSLKTFISRQPRPVWRRFQDFVWLHNALTLEFPACIIPPLPDRRRLEYIKGDRFSTEFIEKRKWSLQWFMDRIACNPQLQLSQSVRIFIESNDFVSKDYNLVPPTASVLESIGGSLLSLFSKIKKPDERFVEMKESFDKIQDNLDTIERLYSRISKRQQDLQYDYAGFADVVVGFSSMETGIVVPLRQFSETVKMYSLAMKDMISKEELLFLNDVHELLSYCHSAKVIMSLKIRDQKQVDFEVLSGQLQQTIQEKERILHSTKYTNSSSLSVKEYVTEKINEVRGIDAQRARREKLERLELKIKELQEDVARTNDISVNFSNQVLKESEIFQKIKDKELKQGLSDYADCHIEFYEKGVTLWENILPILEDIDVGEIKSK
ncbi:hypothetical protein BDF14DRAFT_1733065 [Spinellus fusiger]|nr:hypothetical protein BDF14DRAFT_1733065 [Spinellus fusiger]